MGAEHRLPHDGTGYAVGRTSITRYQRIKAEPYFRVSLRMPVLYLNGTRLKNAVIAAADR